MFGVVSSKWLLVRFFAFELSDFCLVEKYDHVKHLLQRISLDLNGCIFSFLESSE